MYMYIVHTYLETSFAAIHDVVSVDKHQSYTAVYTVPSHVGVCTAVWKCTFHPFSVSSLLTGLFEHFLEVV